MDEKILIKKDSYINVSIQKDKSNNNIDINIKVEPIIEFKDGDILTRKEKDDKLIFIFKDVASDGSLGYYCYYHLKWNKRIYTLGYGIATVDDILNKKVKHATLEDLDEFFKQLQKDGKSWNAEKKCIEDILQFKIQDGSILAVEFGNHAKFLFIAKDYQFDKLIYYHFNYDIKNNGKLYNSSFYIGTSKIRRATYDELMTIFKALEEDNKYWDPKDKLIKEIPQPRKFKKGDKVILAKNKFILRCPVFKNEDDFNKAAITLTDTDKVFTVSGYNKFGLVTVQEESYIIPEQFLEFYKGKQQKFKPGDKVRIKEGILSQIDTNVHPDFNYIFSKYDGIVLTVSKYRYESDLEVKECGFLFNEDWLELYKEEKQHKFKRGDKVMIKNGALCNASMFGVVRFGEDLNKYNAKIFTVAEYDSDNYVRIKEGLSHFNEDWLELVSDELKVGDWVIAWSVVGEEVIAKLENIYGSNNKYKVAHTWYQNAVKWDGTKEQLEKLRKS